MADKDLDLYDLSDHPKHAQRVGQIFAVWASIEYRLGHLYGTLLRAPPWLALSAYFAILNGNARQTMIRALAGKLRKNNPDRQRIFDLLDDIQGAPAARHGYAHKPWIKYKNAVYQLQESGSHLAKAQKRPVSIEQLDSDLSALSKMDQKLKALIADYSRRNPTRITLTPDDEAYLKKLPKLSRHPNP